MNRIEHLERAEIIDAYRVLPRLIMVGYAGLLGYTTFWFMGLADPTTAQTAFIGTLWGACAVVTKWYFDTGRKWTS